MKDIAIVKIAEETADALKGAHPFGAATYLYPSYNALVMAAKANHPTDPFISAVGLIDTSIHEEPPSIAEMRALFAQLRIALDSLREEAEGPR